MRRGFGARVERRDDDPDVARRRRFEELLDANYDRLLGYAIRRLDDPADAADVVGETFLVAWRRIDEVPGGDAARLWLYGVARRTLANTRRGARRRRALHARLQAEIETHPAVCPGPPETDDLRRALGALSADDRELLTLTAWEGLSPSQIAEVLDVEPGTVRVRLHRARRRLAVLLPESDLGKRSAPGGHVDGGRAIAGPSTRKAP